MSGAFLDFSRHIAFISSSSVGGSQKIIASTRKRHHLPSHVVWSSVDRKVATLPLTRAPSVTNTGLRMCGYAEKSS